MQRPRGLELGIVVSGTYLFHDDAAAPNPLSMALTLRPPPWSRALREQTMPVQGILHAGNLAENVPIDGVLRVVGRRRSLDYELAFTGNRGHPYQLRGHEKLRWRALLRPNMELHAEIHDAKGSSVARCHMRVRLRPSWPFGRSLVSDT